jgi:hypothetical protein
MRKTILRRLKVLEEQERARQEQENSSIRKALIEIWQVVLAYYVGGLKPEDDRLGNAYARALKFERYKDYSEALHEAMRTGETDLFERLRHARRQLFALKGNFERASPNEAFQVFVQFVDELPDRWKREIRSGIRSACRLKFPVESVIPPAITSENFLCMHDAAE